MWIDIDEFEWFSLDSFKQELKKAEPTPQVPAQPKQPSQASNQKPQAPAHVQDYMGRMTKVLDGMKHDEKIEMLNNAHNHVESGRSSGKYNDEQAEQLHDAIHNHRLMLLAQKQGNKETKQRDKIIPTIKTSGNPHAIQANKVNPHTGGAAIGEIQPVVTDGHPEPEPEPETDWALPKHVVPVDGEEIDAETAEKAPKTIPPHVSEPCRTPGCAKNQQAPEETPESGTLAHHGYPKGFEEHPIVGKDGKEKPYEDISADDLTSMFHPWRHIEGGKTANLWSKLSDEEKLEHLHNGDILQHVFERKPVLDPETGEQKIDPKTNQPMTEPKYPNTQAAFEALVDKYAWRIYNRAVKTLGLDKKFNLDPNDKSSDYYSEFRDHILRLMRPRVRLGQKHGYLGIDDFDTPEEFYEYKKKNFPNAAEHFSGGLDWSRVKDGKSLDSSIRNKVKGTKGTDGADWGTRLLLNEISVPLNTGETTGSGSNLQHEKKYIKGFDQLINGPANKRERHLRKQLNATRDELKKLALATGMSSKGLPFITDEDTTFLGLRDKAFEAGIDIEEDAHTGEINFVDEKGNKLFSMNGKEPGFVIKLRDKLKERLNPKAIEGGSPMAKVNQYKEALKQRQDRELSLRDKLEGLEKEYQEKYALEPEDYEKSTKEHSSSALSVGTELAKMIQHPQAAQMVQQVNQVVANAAAVIPNAETAHKTDPKQLNTAINGLNSALSSLEGVKNDENREAVSTYQGYVQKLRIDLKKYQELIANMQSGTYANDQDKLLDKLDEVKHDLQLHLEGDPQASNENDKYGTNHLKEQLQKLSQNPDVKNFLDMEDKLQQLEKEYNDVAEEAHQESAEAMKQFGSMDNTQSHSMGSDSDQMEASADSNTAAMQVAADKEYQDEVGKIWDEPYGKDDEGNPIESLDFDIYRRANDKDPLNPDKLARNGKGRAIVDSDKKRQLANAVEALVNNYGKLSASSYGKQAHELLFGGKNVPHGLVHVAEHALAMQVDTGQAQKQIEAMFVPQHDSSGKLTAPAVLKPAKQLSGGGRWKILQYMFEANPNLFSKYALRFSDFVPHPLATGDFFPEGGKKQEHDKMHHEVPYEFTEHDEKHHAGLLKLIRSAMPDNYDEGGDYKHKDEDGDPDWEKMAHLGKQDFQNRIAVGLRLVGNELMKQFMSSNAAYRDVFQIMYVLNQQHPMFKSKEDKQTNEHPGTLRRNLKRLMDVYYGQYMDGEKPHWSPEISDDYHKQWVQKIFGKKVKKSFEIYDLDGRNLLEPVRLVIYD